VKTRTTKTCPGWGQDPYGDCEACNSLAELHRVVPKLHETLALWLAARRSQRLIARLREVCRATEVYAAELRNHLNRPHARTNDRMHMCTDCLEREENDG